MDSSDELLNELEQLLNDEEPVGGNIELSEYTWTPPKAIDTNAAPQSVKLTSEDYDMFAKYENQLTEVAAREKEKLLRQDPLYKAIDDGLINPNDVPSGPLLEAEDLSFQQEYTNPGWFRRTFFNEAPQPVGQMPTYGIDDQWSTVLENDAILPSRTVPDSTAIEMIEMKDVAAQLRNIIPESVSETSNASAMTQAESMIGCGVSPVDVQEMQYIEMQNVSSAASLNQQLPINKLPTLPNEMQGLQPTYVEQELVPKNVPLDLGDPLDDMDMDEWASKEFGDPFESYMRENYPNFDYEMQDIMDEAFSAETSMADYEFSSIYVSALESAMQGAVQIADFGFWDALGAIGTGMLEIGGAGALLIASSQLIPLIMKLKNPHWNSASYDQDMANMIHEEQQLQDHLGEQFMDASTIRGYYVTTPTYVWVKDNGIMGQHDPYDKTNKVMGYSGLMDELTWVYRKMTGTGLWKRARIITAQGKGTGLKKDSKDGIWVYLKFTDNDCDTTIDMDKITTWFRVGVDGPMLPDDEQTRHMCAYYNIMKINSYRPKPQPQNDDSGWGFSDTLIDSDDIFALRDEILDLQREVEFQSDLWWDLEDARYKPVEDIHEIKDTIRQAKNYIRNQRRSTRRPKDRGRVPVDNNTIGEKPLKNRPSRPGRDRRPTFNGTTKHRPQDNDNTDDIIQSHTDTPSHIDQGIYDDSTKQNKISVAIQGDKGYVTEQSGWNIQFNSLGTRRRLTVPTEIRDWFFDNKEGSGLILSPMKTTSKLFKNWNGSFYEWGRNVYLMMKSVISRDGGEKDLTLYKLKTANKDGDRYTNVRDFMNQFKNAHKESRQITKAKSRLFQKERDGFQLLLGMKMVDEFANMDPERFYRDYINEAAGKYQGKKGYIDQYTWGEWEERFKTEDGYATYFYGGMNDVINYFVEAYLQDDEQELTDLGYAFIPATMRFGTLPRADEELDYVQLIKRLQAVLKLSENMPPTEDISSTDKDFPGYSGQKAINTFMTQNRALIEQDIQTLTAWLDDLEPDDLNQSFQSESEPQPKLPAPKPVNEDPPEPEQQDGFDATYSTPTKKKPEPAPPGEYQSDASAPASPLATEVGMSVDRQPEGEIDSEEDEPDLPNQSTIFNAFQQPPEVRRSDRNKGKPRVEYSESVMADRQVPDAIMKEYTLGELHQAYDQFKSDLQTLMPDNSELNYDDAKYARIYQTVGHDDPIIPIGAYKQLSDDPADDSTWTWVFPSEKIDNDEVDEKSNKISDATGLYIQFNKNAGDNSRAYFTVDLQLPCNRQI